MTTFKQQQADKVDEKYFSLQLINPTKKITNETIQQLTDFFKKELDTSVADVVIQPTIMRCKKCNNSK
tara:strand:- start:78 stop:281 length:204 start_codon:yes stop_codon:yes gene_type:complete